MASEVAAEIKWKVTDDGSVWAIVNGSTPVLLDVPDLAKLPPGDYTNEQAAAALQKLGEGKKASWGQHK